MNVRKSMRKDATRKGLFGGLAMTALTDIIASVEKQLDDIEARLRELAASGAQVGGDEQCKARMSQLGRKVAILATESVGSDSGHLALELKRQVRERPLSVIARLTGA